MLNSENNLDDHIKLIRGKIFGVSERIANISSNETMNRIEVRTIKELVSTTVNAILAYGLEALVIDEKEMKEVKNIQYQCIRKMFNIHSFVPSVVIMMEMGILDIDLEI